MPGAGIEYSNVASYVALATIKAGVYTAYAGFLNRLLNGEHAAWLVGLTRAAVGMAVGGAYFWSVVQLNERPPNEGFGFLAYWVSLVPLRIAEWWVILRIFYLPRGDSRITELVLWGVAVSYLADAPAAVGWVITGGFWLVC